MLLGPQGITGRSAWDFERFAGVLGHQLPNAWDRRTFRVCGRAMSLHRAPLPITAFRLIRDGAARNIDHILNTRLCKPRGWHELSRLLSSALQTDAVFYEGPYPMHFSGFLVRGEINVHLGRHLERHGQEGLAEAIASTKPGPVV